MLSRHMTASAVASVLTLLAIARGDCEKRSSGATRYAQCISLCDSTRIRCMQGRIMSFHTPHHTTACSAPTTGVPVWGVTEDTRYTERFEFSTAFDGMRTVPT